MAIAVIVAALAVVMGAPAQAQVNDVDFPLQPGSSNGYVDVLQKRLTWLGYAITDDERASMTLGPSTLTGLHAFEEKFALTPTDEVTETTWNRVRTVAGAVGTLPGPCRTETSICIDTRQRLLRFVKDGRVVLTADARFGLPSQQTARGTFRVVSRDRTHWSRLYRTSMPFALFFHGGQAIHYSHYFARDGYAGASHGCVNLRDRAKAQWVFDHAPIGTRVHIS